ncbi:hypothetical protein E2C01_077413 [Portunus trituberculatus]|uniref:Uncharacterized protein n=1 Tax=Portunus trituberculatus TaxID=210409 RepID=A0A5B7IBE0_PORTR|nr:hypothetical protein [Portunus trituberculatus]
MKNGTVPEKPSRALASIPGFPFELIHPADLMSQNEKNMCGFIYVASNQLGGAAKWEPGIEASARDGFSGTVPGNDLHHQSIHYISRMRNMSHSTDSTAD